VDILYRKLYEVFKKELIKLNIGYEFDRSTLSYMNDLVNAIDFLNNGNPTNTEAITIIRRYER
jgi:hypothetical protein